MDIMKRVNVLKDVSINMNTDDHMEDEFTHERDESMIGGLDNRLEPDRRIKKTDTEH